MRANLFEAEADRCRHLAEEYNDRAEAPFLLSIAKAFEELDTGRYRPRTTQNSDRA